MILRALKFLGWIVAALLLAAFAYGALGWWDARQAAPELSKRARALDAAGEGVAALSQDQLLILLASEDPSFNTHSGVDLSTAGAGATTFTQSLSKKLGFKKFKPGIMKIRQTGFAIGLEQTLTKPEILTLGLGELSIGRAPGGEWVNGLFAASDAFYGKPVKDLSRGEYALLIARLIAPGRFSDPAESDALADRARRILALADGACTPLSHDDVWLEGCAGLPAPLASDAEIDAAIAAPVTGFAANMRWNEPSAPFTVIGNIHYVGTETVSAWLITTPEGHFLIDGIVPQSPPQILENIRTLGFKPEDVKFLLNSHAHIDHAGGLAALKRATGASMVASATDQPFLEAGDIGFGPTGGIKFPPVRVDSLIADGGTLSIGGVTLTAHLTPGHSPGCTSWTLPVTGADGAAHTAFLHCSATVAGQKLVPEAYPGMVADFRSTFEKIRTIEADVFLANHDNFFDLKQKRERLLAGDSNAFVDAAELQAFNTKMEAAFETQLALEEDAPR